MPEEWQISPGDQQTRYSGRRFRIAAKPHLFAQPLVYGIEDSPEVQLVVSSPPSLADMLLCCELDAALLPTVDLCYASGFTVVPAGCVSSSGRSLTARVYSRVRPAKLTTLWADSESHTSTALAQVLWSHTYNSRLDIMPFSHESQDMAEDAEAVLMIGDKVVTEPPLGFDWQVDLSSMWFEMTGLPFVFEVWAAADPDDCSELYRILSDSRRYGLDHLEEIARRHASLFDWPSDLANLFLSRQLQFEFGEAQREGMEEFLSMAAECGVIDEHMPLRYYKPPVKV